MDKLKFIEIAKYKCDYDDNFSDILVMSMNVNCLKYKLYMKRIAYDDVQLKDIVVISLIAKFDTINKILIFESVSLKDTNGNLFYEYTYKDEKYILNEDLDNDFESSLDYHNRIQEIMVIVIRKLVLQLLIDDYISKTEDITIIDAKIESHDDSVQILKNSYITSVQRSRAQASSKK